MRTVIVLRFVGTAYCGWQMQENALSLQQAVQDALEQRYGERFSLTGCSRTDSGVHANGFVAHIDGLDERYIPSLVQAMNCTLPPDIALTSAYKAPEGFHARYSATGKEYVYLLHSSRVRNPFYTNRAAFIHSGFDADRANEVCKAFAGKHDFKAFMASGSKIADTVRTVEYFRAERDERDPELFKLTVKADGFLYNMVRIMAGTVVAEQAGTLRAAVSEIIESGNRDLAGMTMHAHGLYLNRVFY